MGPIRMCVLTALAAGLPACGESGADAESDPARIAHQEAGDLVKDDSAQLPWLWLSCQAQSGSYLDVEVAYRLSTLETFPDGDRHADVHAWFWAFTDDSPIVRGRAEGSLTPRQWYGGAFDL
jgi:hypothetical protein